MIKLLTGELMPQTGECWKHPNARVAYVAQHAFHHIESHLSQVLPLPSRYLSHLKLLLIYASLIYETFFILFRLPMSTFGGGMETVRTRKT